MFSTISATRRAFYLLALAFALPQSAMAQQQVISSGTGFFINSNGWAITNAHVLQGCNSVTVPQIGEAVDWLVDKQNDLAAIRLVGGAGKPTLPLRKSAPRLGEDIAAFGFPLNGVLSDSIKVTTGNVNSLVGMENDVRYLQISTPLQPGNSGGPIVDRHGSVVGVATAALGSNFEKATGVSTQNVNFAVRSGIVELFLQSRNIRYESLESVEPELSTADLSEKVVPAVVTILCHGPAPAVAETTTEQTSAPPPSKPADVAAPIRTFRFLDNHDVIGFDYATLRSVTRAECQGACEADASCRAITYNKKEHFCFLKSDAKLIVRNNDAFANVSEDLSSSVLISTFSIYSSRDMAGGDYKRIRNSSFVGCYLACESDAVCRAFAYVRNQQACWLKNGVGRVSRKAGVDLGVR